jgi:hypothetical protein
MLNKLPNVKSQFVHTHHVDRHENVVEMNNRSGII